MTSDESVMVFTYGMLTSSSVMHLNCSSARAVEVGFLPKYQLAFDHHATLIPRESGHVYGMIWSIDSQELANLDQVESYPVYYNRKKMWIYGDKAAWRCWVYIMNHSKAGAAPDEQYLQCLRFGYNEHNLHWMQVQQALDAIPSQAQHST